MAEFFTRNIIEVYFLYGLSFFCLGLAIMVEVGQTTMGHLTEPGHATELDFGQALLPLAGFGFIHGVHEWLEMFLLIHTHLGGGPVADWIFPLRIAFLASSFLFLIAFGSRLIAGQNKRQRVWGILLAALLLWTGGMLLILATHPAGEERNTWMDVSTRYLLAIPGAILTAYGLLLQRRRFNTAGMKSFGRDVALAALAFAIYGAIGQLFAARIDFFPSAMLNPSSFLSWFGFPIQVLRACMASLIAVFMIRSLRAFAVQTARRIEQLREAQIAEQRRSEKLQAEFLHRTVNAQESERQRIARELHDETGQTLTGLSLGLRGLAENIHSDPQRSVKKALQLESMAANGIQELQRVVSGLRPPQLDELGLEAALRWLAQETSPRSGLKILVSNLGLADDLPPDVRTVLFRISQEAVTNIVRHAEATQAMIELDCQENQVILRVKDNGKGFEVASILNQQDRPCWGLLGMMERAALVGGVCTVDSQPGRGTLVQVQLKFPKGDEYDPSVISG